MVRVSDSKTCREGYKLVDGECVKKLKGLIVNIYKHEGQSHSIGGVSHHHNDALLVMDHPSAQIFEESYERPTLKVVRRMIFGEEYIHAEPVSNAIGSYAAGGTFIASSDSRFSRFVNKYPISLHDRDMALE